MKSKPTRFTLIAPVGGDIEAVYMGIREFPTEKIFLIHSGKDSPKTESFERELQKFRIPLQRIEVKGTALGGILRAFAQIKATTSEEKLLVNVSSGDKNSATATLAAAFVNGLKAFHVDGERVVMFPVLKFSYYRLLPGKKLAVLRFLMDQPECCSSLEDLAKRTGMSLPLVSYHINGNAKAEGLISLGLVEVQVAERGRTQVMLSEMGRLIVDGMMEIPAREAREFPGIKA